MNFLIDKPHIIYLLTIPIIMLIGILSRDVVLDINVHDSYFVITYLHFAILLSMLFGIIGIGYWIIQKTGRKLSKWLSSTHIGLTFGGILVVWILTKLYRTEIMEYEFNYYLSKTITVVILLMIVGQLTFPINIVCGLLKKNKTKSQ